MRARDPRVRKNVLCLSKALPKALRELLAIRGDTVTLAETTAGLSDYEKTSKLMKKKQCSLCVASAGSSLILTRSFDFQPLEILKFRVLKSLSSADFKTVPAELFSKYFILCQSVENKRIENLFIDLFSQGGPKVNLDAVRYAWIVNEATVDGQKVFTVKYVRVLRDLSVEDIGPHFELALEEQFFCGDELHEKAHATHKAKKEKNVSKNVFKDKIGKLHIERQDLNEINLKKSRACKKALSK